MRKPSYKTILHSYLIFFVIFLCLIFIVIGIFLSLITIQQPNGKYVHSDWAKKFTEDFNEQIMFIDNKPQIKEYGLEKLQENKLWLQILDSNGNIVYGFSEPKDHKNYYSNSELLALVEQNNSSDGTTYFNTITNNKNDFIYIIHFPLNISKVNMFFDGNKFIGGKSIIFSIIVIIFLIILIFGVIYSYWVTKCISNITIAVSDVSKRSYLPIKIKGVFADVYNSLNLLSEEIHKSDEIQKKTDIMREEWISNITHDLKTPLSPIKGYAELLADNSITHSSEKIHKYASIMLKNIEYTNKLISDLKLTYQLQNGIIPLNKKNDDLVRFLKELSIDILNYPEYESNIIEFKNDTDIINFSFDYTLLKRAFSNLIINAFTYGNKDTKVIVNIALNEQIEITISDNGKGITREEVSNLFNRYYRGTMQKQRKNGTGLGLAITKQIIEIHKGDISIESELGLGSSFHICFPLN
ncbi:HAMP domain-containing histidine kinase [Clostridioides difficile]|nr:HAMP domain-containing histidine kinase [Clostridioides difficile]